jgi:uncharacterized protein with GYD domain
MPTYISLINWTDQGIRTAKQTTDRASAAADLAIHMGGELKHVFWTVGSYDIVAISEFPDDQIGTAYLLALGAQGNVRTTTMRAFDSDEIAEIIAKVRS